MVARMDLGPSTLGGRTCFLLFVAALLLLSAAPLDGAAPARAAPPTVRPGAPDPASLGPWTNVTPANGTAPPGGAGAVLVNDSVAGYDLWFGGSVASSHGPIGATWIYRDGNWTNVTASQAFSPPARTFAAASYDAANRVVVLFGGLGDPTTYLGDTWLWANDSWTNITAYAGAGPSPRAEASMAYDARDQEVLLFGGIDSNGSLGDTWVFSTGQWDRLLPTPAPPAACCGSMAYDSSDQETVLLIPNALDTSTSTWTFVGGNWTERSGAPSPARQWAVMVDDPAVNGTLLYGGSSLPTSPYDPLRDTWIFAANRWSSAGGAANSSPAPPASWGAAAAPEVPSGPGGCFLLVGGWGVEGPGPLEGVVWQGCGNRSVWASGGGGGKGEVPPTLTVSADVYSGDAPLAVNFSAAVANGTAPFNLSLCASGLGCQNFLGWSGTAPQNRTVVFNLSGTYGLTAFVVDAEGNSASASASVVVAQPAPLEVTVQESPVQGLAPLSVRFTSSIVGGTGPYTIEWQLGDGIEEPGAEYNYTYPKPGEYYPVVVVTDHAGQRVEKPLPPIDVEAPASPPGPANPPWTVAYGLSLAIVGLGVIGAFVVYRVRRRRVVTEAEKTIREVEEDESAGPPGSRSG